jgi:hypothetical protein
VGGGTGYFAVERLCAGETQGPRGDCDNPRVADVAPKMVFLGFGKFARADKIYALEPLRGKERGEGRRTRVWVEGIAEPIVASRTERSILGEMGMRDAGRVQILDDAVKLAERIVEDAGRGRVDLADLDRRARKLLESTARPSDDDQLF